MRSKAALFIGISALLHLLVGVLLTDQINTHDLKEQGRSNFSIIITPANNIITSDSVLENSSKKQISASNPDPKVITSQNTKIPPPRKQQFNSKKTTELSVTESVKNIKRIDKKSNSINSQQIESIIKTELSKYFYYPKSAQRKNWQGQVILSFTILPSGSIDKIQINKSSGYTSLDNAAINALGQIKREKSLSLALNGHRLEQLLPVSYKLHY